MFLERLNRMAGFRYLSNAQLRGFDQYKYSCIDTSPLSNYVLHPFWNTVVKLVPKWVAPNLLTFSGFCLLLVNLAVLSYFDWDYNTTSNDVGIVRPPIPSWVWLFCCITHFMSYTLDGIDGKQARRTGSSSPLGELFDHGLDSLAAILIPVCLFSAFGRGKEWGGDPADAFLPTVAVLAGFFIAHWEKYSTGVLYLPWTFDAIHLGITLGYFVTFLFGVEVWHFRVLPGVNASLAIRVAIIVGTVLSLPMTCWNMWRARAASSEPPSPTSSSSSSSPPPAGPRRHSILQSMAPWLPFVLLVFLQAAWMNLSETHIFDREPRLFALSLGIVFSNITCRLIIAQMSSQPCELFNVLLMPLSMAVAASILQPSYELPILYAYTATVTVAHIHYGMSVVNELCTHFKIYCLTLKKPL